MLEKENGWLDDVYGTSSTLVNEKWVETVQTTGKWIFDAAEIRARLFDLAQVEVKHMI